MNALAWGTRLRRLLRAEWQHLLAFQSTQRQWPMPLAAALATGLPVLAGAWFGQIEAGLVTALGGLTFLYLTDTPMHHRMGALMACGFAMVGCYAAGIGVQLLDVARVPLLALLATLVTMACRYYRLAPPGAIFFVMAAAIGAYTPIAPAALPGQVGLLFLGAWLATLIAFGYSLVMLRRAASGPIALRPPATFDFVVVDAVVIGGFVGLSLLVAEALRLDRPYWVPVSCLAVLQGVSLRAVWNRQLHRVAGTTVGMLVAWGLLSLPLSAWTIALWIMALTFTIEWLVVRHYGLAVVFITPLTILLADAAALGQQAPGALIQTRFIDTALGCLVGLLGGIWLHSPRLRAIVARPLRALVPARLR